MSDSSRTRPAEPRIAYEDVDELISTATRLMQKDAAPDTLTVEDLRQIGQELDIPAEYVDRARAVLEERRQREAQAREGAERRARARRSALIRGAWMAAAVGGVLVLGAVPVRNGLQGSLAEVTRQRAQVHNVVERRERVQERYATSTPGPERDAQLSGADNRVSVEQRRYDELATNYNRSASSFPSSWVVRLTGLPASVPLSNEVSSW
jgi:hypothetical protein